VRVQPIAVSEFDRVPVADAAAELLACCRSPRWISALVSGRPYGRLERLSARSDDVLGGLDDAEISDALADAPVRDGGDPVADRALLSRIVRRRLAAAFH
jgi:hypothetical protein